MGKKIKPPKPMSGSRLNRATRSDVFDYVREKVADGEATPTSLLRDHDEWMEKRMRERFAPKEGPTSDFKSLDLWGDMMEKMKARKDELGSETAEMFYLAETLMPGYTRLLLPLVDRTPTDLASEPKEELLALATYLWLRRTLVSTNLRLGAPGAAFTQDRVKINESQERLHEVLKDARVLAYPTFGFAKAVYDLDHLIHDAAGIEYQPPPDEEEENPPDFSAWNAVARFNLPSTLPMPFPRVILVHGCGSIMPFSDVRWLASSWVKEKRQYGINLAHLLDDERGDAWQISSAEEADGTARIHCTRVRRDGAWTDAAKDTLIPHALYLLLSASKTFTGKAPERSLSQRRALERLAATDSQTLRIPPPFYVVRNKPTAPKIAVPPREPVHHASPSFRFDVRSHDRIFLHRGEAPVEPAIAKRLEKRGYMFFTDAWPAGLAEACRSRGHEDPQKGEWLAIRVVKVKAHLKGPEDAEYVPSLRVPSPDEQVEVN